MTARVVCLADNPQRGAFCLSGTVYSGGGGSGFLGLGGQPGNGGPTEVIENVTQNFHAEPGGGDVGNGGDGGNAGGGDGMRQLADDAGAGWSGFDDDAAFDDDRFV